MSTTPDEQPLSIAWRDWIARQRARDVFERFDAIVVGSGYGGSVATLRLAQKGYRVLLLERGGEYLPGDFPNDFGSLPKHLRAAVPGLPQPLGRASGLFELTVGQGIAALTANGLGGGSLINAGVVMRPDADVFAQDAWPTAIRHGAGLGETQGDLGQAFERAHATLGAKPYQPPAGGDVLKAQALEACARLVRPPVDRRTTVLPDLTQNPTCCSQCGDCASGCNVKDAKGDLRSTYLREALATGRVQIVTHAEVHRFDRAGTAGARHWRLRVFAVDAQQQKLTRQEAGDTIDRVRDPVSTLRTLRTRLLVISAGTIGSTQLLQRSQALAGERLAFSPALGTRLSGNGDSISVLLDPKQRVNAIGHGSDPYRHLRSPKKAADHAHIVGPTITGSLDLRDKHLPLTKRLLLQDGAIPGALARVFAELLATSQTLAQLGNWSCIELPPHGVAREPADPLGASPEAVAHTQIWLTMGHDGSVGRMLWMPGTDTSAMVMPEPETLETYREQQALFDRLKGSGLHLHNPLWQSLPPAAAAMMSGAKPPRWLTTVHPLGGCPMGDDPLTSVVNHLGQVWVHDPASPQRQIDTFPSPDHPSAPCVYPGLYVLDGSIVPTSLGCNPLLTITALAERAIALACLPAPGRQALPAVRVTPPREPVKPMHPPPRVDAVLRETLRAQAPRWGSWAAARPNLPLHLRLDAELASDDLESTLAEGRHRFRVPKARLDLGWYDPDAPGDQPLETRTYLRGHAPPARDEGPAWFDFLPAGAGSSGHWPAIFTFAELLVWLGVPLVCVAIAIALLFRCEFSQALGLLALAASAFALGGVVAVAPRTLVTWYLLRGHADSHEGGLRKLWDALKSLVHAREKRRMDYRVPMTLDPQSGPPTTRFPEHIVLIAHKRVTYRASVPELLVWLARQLRRKATGSTNEIPPLRPSFWTQMMDAQVTIRPRGRARLPGPGLLTCKMKMGFDSLLSQRAAQLGERGDTTTGLLMLAGYALLAARFAIKTRLYDFRLPAYSERPVPDQTNSSEHYLRVLNAHGQEDRVPPERHTVTVGRGASSGDEGTEPLEDLALNLYRYRRRDAQGQPAAPEFVRARHADACVARVKSVLLLHAFGQSGLSYTFRAQGSAPGSNLAEALFADGYEVWVLDSRMSTRSGQAERASNVDMQARHDVPGAIEHIRRQLRRELDLQIKGHELQIAAFAQCIGSAALWMALLEGRLGRSKAAPPLWAAVFSQVHALVRGTPDTRAKSWLPAQLRHLMPAVPFAVRGPQSGLWQAMDRLLASMPAPEAERRIDKEEDGIASCRRIRLIEAPLFRHANMGRDTIDRMNLLFGPANLRLFAHARRFVEHRRLVDEDGINRYVTDDNLRKHLNLPVQLLHGRENELFDVRSAHDTFDWLRQQHPSCVQLAGAPLVVPGYGHLDVLLGRNASQDVFPRVLDFFRRALVDTRAVWSCAPQAETWQVRAPRVAPTVGWVHNAGATPAVRVAFMVDDLHGGTPTQAQSTRVVIRLFDPQQGRYVSIASHHAQTQPAYAWRSDPDMPLVLAYRSVQVDAHPPAALWCAAGAGEQDVAFQALTLHCMGDPEQALPPALSDEQIDQQLAQDAERVRQHNTMARFDGREARESMLDRVGFSVPRASWRALRGMAAPPVEFLAGCCRYPGLTVDQDRIDDGIADALDRAPRPAFALLVGDQIYADATAGLADPTSPLERFVERHEHAFGAPGMRRLLTQVPTLMTPDDHEWIDNYPLSSPLLKWRWPDWRRKAPFAVAQWQRFTWAHKAVHSFQRLQGRVQKGRQVSVGPYGAVRLFIIDTRAGRRRKSPGVVPKQVLKMLHAWLAQGSPEQLNVVVSGSVALPGLHWNADPAAPGAIDTWQHAPMQRKALLDILVHHSLHHDRRFMLLSGDYHVSAAAHVVAGGKTVGAAVVVPPIYAPLPYANAQPEHLNLTEPLFAAGQALCLLVPPNGEVRRGSGMARLMVTRLDNAHFQIAFTRDLRCFEDGTRHTPQQAQTALLVL